MKTGLFALHNCFFVVKYAYMSKSQTLDKWMPQSESLSPKKRCVIYDFDGTLFLSPDRESGEVLYLEGTGSTWPYQGWWGRIESLMPPVVPDPIPHDLLVASTVEAYRKDCADTDTNLVLMTGRPFKARKRVQEILDHFDLKFHAYHYRGMKGQKGRDTLEIKLNIIESELLHPKLEILEIWEDRPEHTSAFLDHAKRRWRHLSVVVHDVLAGTHHQLGGKS